jgi:WD40 repeat protein
VTTGAPPRTNPYVGPRAFVTGEPLYGRDRELYPLLHLLIADRIVLLYSPSGAGKTSLIQAGLVPLLLGEQFRVLPIVRVNLEPSNGRRDADQLTATEPVTEPAAGPTPNRYLLSVLVSLEEGVPEGGRLSLGELAGMDLAAYLARRYPPGADGGERVLIIDQFEEILTVDPADQGAKQVFFAQLGEALRDRSLWALFAIREDYVAALDPYLRPMPTRLQHRFRLDLLDAEQALEAIERPAQREGIAFTEGAGRRLLDDLRRVQVQRPDGSTVVEEGPYVEPVQLQVVCLRLWERLPTDATEIREADLAAVGDVDEALADYYAERVAAAAARAGVPERAIREWVDERLITPQGIRGQVLQEAGRSGGLENRAIRALVDAHLVRAEQRRGFTWFELAHDRLIAPVRADNGEWGEAYLSVLQRQAALWERQDRPTGLLLVGEPLAEAARWAAAHPGELSVTDREFLDACRAAEAAATRERRRNRLLRLALAAVTGLLLLALATGVFAVAKQREAEAAAKSAREALANEAAAREDAGRQAKRAEEQAGIARARGLAGQAAAHYRRQLDTALLLSMAGHAFADTVETRAALLDGLAFDPRLARFLHGRTQYVDNVVISPDGSLLAVGGVGPSINLWNVSTGQTLGELLLGDTGRVASLAFSPDGRTLASTGQDGVIRLWDVTNRQFVGEPLTGHAGPVYSVAFSPDGRLLASSGAGSTIRLWDVSTGQLRAELPVGQVFSSRIAFGPDGRTLASIGSDGAVRRWDVATGERLSTFGTGITRDVSDLEFSSDGRLLTIVSGVVSGSIGVWDITTGRQIVQIVVDARELSSVAFSPEGRRLGVGGFDGIVRLWDLASGRQAGEPLVGHPREVSSIAFSSDGRTLASAGSDGSVRLWDLEAAPSLGEPLAGVPREPRGVAFSPDGRLLAAVGDGPIGLWDMATRRQFGEPLRGHTSGLLGVAFSPDGRLLASAGGRPDGTIGLWDVAAGTPLGESLSGHGEITWSVAFSPDGQRLASGGADGAVRLWDVSTRRSLGEIPIDHTGPVHAVVFSPDGRLLASAGMDGTIRLSDLATDRAGGATLTGHADSVRSVVFSPDGRLLASSDFGGTIRLWDAAAGRQIGEPLRGHAGPVWNVAFSPDGRLLASASSDGTVRLWDVAAGLPLGEPLTGATDSAGGVAFSPDGSLLAASGDGTVPVRLWDIRYEAWAARACRIVNRNLSMEEWRRFVDPEIAYRRTCPELPPGEGAPDDSP